MIIWETKENPIFLSVENFHILRQYWKISIHSYMQVHKRERLRNESVSFIAFQEMR